MAEIDLHQLCRSHRGCSEGLAALESVGLGPGVFVLEEALRSPEGQGMILGDPVLRRFWGWAVREGILPAWSMAGADLRGVDLAGADLTGANLKWAELAEANLRGADLAGALGAAK